MAFIDWNASDVAATPNTSKKFSHGEFLKLAQASFPTTVRFKCCLFWGGKKPLLDHFSHFRILCRPKISPHILLKATGVLQNSHQKIGVVGVWILEHVNNFKNVIFYVDKKNLDYPSSCREACI